MNISHFSFWNKILLKHKITSYKIIIIIISRDLKRIKRNQKKFMCQKPQKFPSSSSLYTGKCWKKRVEFEGKTKFKNNERKIGLNIQSSSSQRTHFINDQKLKFTTKPLCLGWIPVRTQHCFDTSVRRRFNVMNVVWMSKRCHLLTENTLHFTRADLDIKTYVWREF